MKTTLLAILSIVTSSLLIAEKPNIILIVSDDMGYSDLGCYGGEIDTPQLDALAKQGLRFTNYYVNNMCYPTRASLMTSLYPKSVFMKSGGSEDGMAALNTTLPEALKTAGYTTLMSGKWHLSGVNDEKNFPHNRGFDKYYGNVDGTSDFYAPAHLQLNGEDREYEWKNNPDFYYTDRITDNALNFLKDTNGPFFLYLCYNAAHWPLHAKPEDIEKYQGRFAKGWDKLREERYARMEGMGLIDNRFVLSDRNEEVPSWEKEEHKDWQQRRMEVYAAQITCMDQNISRVIDYLKKTNQFDNTLILYQHDNGGCHVEYAKNRTGTWTKPVTTDGKKTPIVPGNIPGIMPGPQSTFQSYGYGWANLSNTPFRYYKQYDHEGGTRSPLIVSWPDKIAKNKRGSLIHQVNHAIDMMPTLLEVAGADPVQQKPVPMEGRSFYKNLLGKDSSEQRTLFWQHNKGRAVRQGDWKLVSKDKGDTWELYNLKKDPVEMDNLVDEMPERFAKMKALHTKWMKKKP